MSTIWQGSFNYQFEIGRESNPVSPDTAWMLYHVGQTHGQQLAQVVFICKIFTFIYVVDIDDEASWIDKMLTWSKVIDDEW